MTLVIGVGGWLTAGKDEVADHLVKEHGFVKLGMSDTLAEALYRLNPLIPVSEEALRGVDGQWVPEISSAQIEMWPYSTSLFYSAQYQDIVDELGYVEAKKNPEVRRLLQVLGTEVGRQLISDDVWVQAAKKKIFELVADGKSVVITGIRYANELAMIEELFVKYDLAATSVWVDRESARPATTHSSETSLSSQDFEYVLPNNGSLEELYARSTHLLATIQEDF